jgi:hypothetical protein
MKRQGTKKIGNVISYIFILLAITAVCGFLAYFTNGFTSDFVTFYVECEGQQVLSSAGGFEMTTDEPLTVDVKYTFSAVNKEISGYSVKIVPNKVPGKDFDFTLNGAAYSFQAEDDMTQGFDITEGETSFTVKPKGGINDILKAVYPDYEISDVRDNVYENMFTLVIISYNGKASVNLNFTVTEKVKSVTLDQEVIIF